MIREELLEESLQGRKSVGLGMPIGHESAEKHVSGSALYVDDINAPENMLYGYVGLSEIARGTIRKIADKEDYEMPATIDDPAILTEITEDLIKNNILKK